MTIIRARLSSRARRQRGPTKPGRLQRRGADACVDGYAVCPRDRVATLAAGVIDRLPCIRRDEIESVEIGERHLALDRRVADKHDRKHDPESRHDFVNRPAAIVRVVHRPGIGWRASAAGDVPLGGAFRVAPLGTLPRAAPAATAIDLVQRQQRQRTRDSGDSFERIGADRTLQQQSDGAISAKDVPTLSASGKTLENKMLGARGRVIRQRRLHCCHATSSAAHHVRSARIGCNPLPRCEIRTTQMPVGGALKSAADSNQRRVAEGCADELDADGQAVGGEPGRQ